MARVKICGVTDTAGLDAAGNAGADWIGLVFAAGSPRSLTHAQAAALGGRPHGPLRVGLFVDPSDAEVAAALAAVRLDILQLYTGAARAAELRARFGVAVWRAVAVTTAADLPSARAGVDGYVIEPPPPPGAALPGGNAASFEPAFLRGWRAPLPWLLAGGLSPDTVAAAIATTGATSVDVSSGVERVRGHKDPALIQAFVAAAKAA